MIDAVERDAAAILQYWFSSLDDGASLEPSAEPFRTHYARWYGKEPEIDDQIRERFEPLLEATLQGGAQWASRLDAWSHAPKGLLALVILLDQLPRNMYRDSPAMYAHDPLALVVATEAIRQYADADLALVQRMFLYVPLMHAENATLQQVMVGHFEALVAMAAERSPHNLRFFEYALEYARRHCHVVERFGRFPHRNAILGRSSTAEELEFLSRDGSTF